MGLECDTVTLIMPVHSEAGLDKSAFNSNGKILLINSLLTIYNYTTWYYMKI